MSISPGTALGPNVKSAGKALLLTKIRPCSMIGQTAYTAHTERTMTMAEFLAVLIPSMIAATVFVIWRFRGE
jgi:hypothetical protein